jgi:iron(III) transport system permease protein
MSSSLAPAPVRSRFRLETRSRQALFLAIPVLVLLAWTVAWPNVAVIRGSFEHGWDYWREFAHSPSDREALSTSLYISALSVIGAVGVGLPLALLLGRMDFPGRRWLSAVATLPAALPPLVGVVAFLFLYGDSGFITRIVSAAFGSKEPLWRFRGVSAIVFVHAYTMYVYVYLFVMAGLERVDSSLEEAAAGLGYGRWGRLRKVTLPLLTPALAGSMLLVFMSSLGSYSAPYVFGGGIRVLSTQIVTSKLNGAMGMAYVETTVLAVSAVLALLLLRFMERRRQYVAVGKGTRRRNAVTSPVWRKIAPVLASVVVLILVLPHFTVLLVALAKEGTWTDQLFPPVYTLENFGRLARDPELWTPIKNSVLMGLLSTGANIIVCFLAAYLVVMRKFPGRRLLELLLAMPWAIPATAIAIGLASTFNKNDLLGGRVLLIGTFWILPLAYFIRGVPLVASAVESSLRQLDASLEDAARGLGASWFRIMWRIILPAVRPGLAAGALLAAITAVGEFVASVVLYTNANRPISIEILSQIRALSMGTAAAYSVLLILLVLIITAIARTLELRSSESGGVVSAN